VGGAHGAPSCTQRGRCVPPLAWACAALLCMQLVCALPFVRLCCLSLHAVAVSPSLLPFLRCLQPQSGYSAMDARMLFCHGCKDARMQGWYSAMDARMLFCHGCYSTMDARTSGVTQSGVIHRNVTALALPLTFLLQTPPPSHCSLLSCACTRAAPLRARVHPSLNMAPDALQRLDRVIGQEPPSDLRTGTVL